MFVKLNSPEEAAELFAKLADEYVDFVGDAAYQQVSMMDFDIATQKFPVTVFVQHDDEFTHTFIHFPSKIHTLEEL